MKEVVRNGGTLLRASGSRRSLVPAHSCRIHHLDRHDRARIGILGFQGQFSRLLWDEFEIVCFAGRELLMGLIRFAIKLG